MKRLPGIIFSAVLLALGSLFQLLMAFGMVSAGFIERSQIRAGVTATTRAGAPMAPIPPWMPIFMYGLAVFFVALAVWGALTTIGLFRLWRWARYSMLVIAGCLVLIALPSMLLMLVLVFVPVPLPSTLDASQAQTAHTMVKAIFGGISVFYAIMCAIGVSWLIYFNRKNVRHVFAGMPAQVVENPRPFLISVIAVFCMIGAITGLLVVFVPFPVAFLGFILHGWQKAVLYLFYTGLLAGAAVGLWRLEEWGRRLAIAVQIVALAQYVVFLVRPSLMSDYNAQVNQALHISPPPATPQIQSMFYIPIFGFGILFILAVLWVLIHYGRAFQRPLEPPQIEAAQLPLVL
jgi:hypothetical protein